MLSLCKRNNMQVIANPGKYTEKEQLYFDVRNKEGRIITDEVLRSLPYVNSDSPYKKEWNIRAENFEKFLKYISGRNRKLNILDIGCGNGWMTHRLSESGHYVAGIDLNMAELMQAEKVFGTTENLQWVYADIMTDVLPYQDCDIILFSASCQYFDDIEQLTKKASAYLKSGGEIHFTDSIFYKESKEAKSRSDAYYAQLAFPEMSKYYHHHSITTLKKAGYKKKAPGFFQTSPLQWWCYTKA